MEEEDIQLNIPVSFQIGFEPIVPRRTTTIFGKPALVLPNIFQYGKHLQCSLRNVLIHFHFSFLHQKCWWIDWMLSRIVAEAAWKHRIH